MQFGKRFDCVNHNILLSKLEFYGIIGRSHKLIKILPGGQISES